MYNLSFSLKELHGLIVLELAQVDVLAVVRVDRLEAGLREVLLEVVHGLAVQLEVRVLLERHEVVERDHASCERVIKKINAYCIFIR